MALLQYYPDTIANIVAGILVIAFGIIVANILAVLLRKILRSFEVDRILQSQGMGFPVEGFASNLVRYVIYIVGLIWGLTFLGLETIVLYIILLGILGILVIFILLSLKDFIPNSMAGLILHLTKKVKRGEHIKLENAEGKVLKVSLLDTKMKTPDGDQVLIPNILIVKSKIMKKK